MYPRKTSVRLFLQNFLPQRRRLGSTAIADPAGAMFMKHAPRNNRKVMQECYTGSKKLFNRQALRKYNFLQLRTIITSSGDIPIHACYREGFSHSARETCAWAMERETYSTKSAEVLTIIADPDVSYHGCEHSFENMGLSESLCSGVKELGITAPTEIQKTVIPKILSRCNHVVVSSETGSGKTLSFLLPFIQLLKEDEAISEQASLPARPKVLVLVPTRELAVQVHSVAKQLSHSAKFRPILITGGAKRNHQKKWLREPIDMVIGTPSRVLDLWQKQKLFFGHILYVAIDEADTLLGDREKGGFADDVLKIMSTMTNRKAIEEGGKPNAQLVFTGATVDRNWEEKGRDTSRSCLKKIRELAKIQGNHELNIVKSDHLKALASGIQCEFVNATMLETKHPTLANILSEIETLQNIKQLDRVHTLVFCNSIASCRSTAYYLEKVVGSDTFVGSLHGGMPPQVRDEHWNEFLKNMDSDYKHKILICTDIASRGLDFDQSVDNIVMFDLPRSFSDFVHRAGRTARGVGATGKVSVIVAKSKSEKFIAEKLAREVHQASSSTKMETGFESKQKTPSRKVLSKFDRYSVRSRSRVVYGNALSQKHARHQKRKNARIKMI